MPVVRSGTRATNPELREDLDALQAEVAGISGGGVSDGNKGDITVSGAGTNWQINAGSVGTNELGGDVTTAGKALLDDATAAAQRTTLGLGNSATLNTGTAAGTVATGDHTHSGYVSGSGVLQVNIYTTSGSPHTWTKHASAQVVGFILIGGGGGGGGAGLAPTTRRDLQGQGAGGGCIVECEWLASAFSSTETVTIGAGGTGGTPGTAGTDGGDTTFGSKITAKGGVRGRQGGQAVDSSSGRHCYLDRTIYSPNAPIQNNVGTGSATVDMPGGGGSGGAGLGANNGKAGSAMRIDNSTIRDQWNILFPSWTHTLLQAAGGTGSAGGTPGNGNPGQSVGGLIGLGGSGGGGCNSASNGGDGGAGGSYGGGGGGGGGNNDTGGSGGSGGNGGGGVCIVIQYG